MNKDEKLTIGFFFTFFLLILLGQILHSIFSAPPATHTGTYTVLTAEKVAAADFDNHVHGIINKQIRYPVMTVDGTYFLQNAADETVYIGEVYPNTSYALYYISSDTIVLANPLSVLEAALKEDYSWTDVNYDDLFTWYQNDDITFSAGETAVYAIISR